jgi:hypothetical protein
MNPAGMPSASRERNSVAAENGEALFDDLDEDP